MTSPSSLSRVRVLAVEPLEFRRMLVWTASFDAGLLNFFGTPGDDQIQEIRGAPPTGGGADVVWFDQEVAGPPPAIVSIETPISAADVKEIRIWAREGDDKIFLEDGFPFIDPLERLWIVGELGDDWIRSVPAGEVLPPTYPLFNIRIEGLEGWDTVEGGGDPEEIYGGSEPDHLWGGGGDDRVDGGPGDDEEVSGDGDNDYLTGGTGDDKMDGGAGNDRLWGDGGNDRINGGTQQDFISGGDNNDTLNGNDGWDWIQGGGGNDTINGGDHPDLLMSNGWGGVDQPWRANGAGNPAWFDMDGSGPDTDDDCDIEDWHPDLDGMTPCAATAVVATDDGYAVSHGSVISHTQPGAPTVLANDTYPPPGPPTIIVTHPPQHGSLAMQTDGKFAYDPDNSFVGTDYFVYFLSYNGVDSAHPAVVTINVTNATPSAVPDTGLSTSRNTPKTVNVVVNPGPPNGSDTDADGDYLEIDSVTQPTNGTVTFSGQSITYTPNPGWPQYGMAGDSFTYKVKDPFGAISNSAGVSITVYGTPLMLDQPEVEPTADTRSIKDVDLALLVGEAASRWVTAGVDPVAMKDVLAGTEFVIADLPGSMLGGEMPGTIAIDVNAAGHGWFVDATAALDEEFSIVVTPSERQAAQGSAAYGRADLLTVLMHELGHALGMPHLEGEEFEHSVMHDTLGLSMRRSPTAADLLAADEYFASLAGTGSLIKRRW